LEFKYCLGFGTWDLEFFNPMRIIAGEKKGFKLNLISQKARPTQEKVRGAIFNILKDEIINTAVLDLFCGSGALGLEALSRGAKVATFIDNDIRSLRVNIRKLDIKNVTIIKGDAFREAKRLTPRSFNIIFLDPPYLKNLVNRAIISVLDLLVKSGIIVVEHHKKETIVVPAGIFLFKEKSYGDIRVSFLMKR